MLSTRRFNALLKTLEEPPPHAKFVFATTEIRKVPVTILSRCQRFDLRRVERRPARRASADASAGRRASRSSPRRWPRSRARRKARCATRCRCSTRRSPTAPAGRRRDACATCSASPTAAASSTCSRRRCAATCRPPSRACAANTTPAPTRRVVLSDLAAFTHLVTRLKLVPEAAEGSEPDRGRARPRRRVRRARCRPRALSRAWQMLLKGVPEVQPRRGRVAAAEMALVRLAYAADLPHAGRGAARSSRTARRPRPSASSAGRSGAAAGPGPPSRRCGARDARRPKPLRAASRASRSPAPRLRRFEDVVALAGEQREIALKSALERDVRLVRFEEGRIEFALAEGAQPQPRRTTSSARSTTGPAGAGPWRSPPSPARRRCTSSARPSSASAAATPPATRSCRRCWSRFPGAEIVDVRDARERGRGRSRSGAAGRSGGRRGSGPSRGRPRGPSGTTRPDQGGRECAT